MVNKPQGPESQKSGSDPKKGSSATSSAVQNTKDSVNRVMNGGSGNSVAGKVANILSGKK